MYYFYELSFLFYFFFFLKSLGVAYGFFFKQNRFHVVYFDVSSTVKVQSGIYALYALYTSYGLSSRITPFGGVGCTTLRDTFFTDSEILSKFYYLFR